MYTSQLANQAVNKQFQMKAEEQWGDPGCYGSPYEGPNLDQEVKEDFLEGLIPELRPKG